MNIFASIILGVVEGITEFLPVSSTFHLIVTSKILSIPNTEFLKLYEVVIQSGAISALLFIYLKLLLSDIKLFRHVLISFLPTAFVGVVLHQTIKTVFFESGWLLLLAFMSVGVIFILLESYLAKYKVVLSKNCDQMSTKEAMIIGCAQAISVVPGVSRAGSVIVAMMSMGYQRAEAAKYTFLLSMPTILGASALDLYLGRSLLTGVGSNWTLLGVGFLVSAAVAYFVVKWFIAYLSTHTLSLFGWYRVIVALALATAQVLP